MKKQVNAEKATKGNEYDIHVWHQNAEMVTVSVGRRALAVDVSIETAVDAIQDYMRESEAQ